MDGAVIGTKTTLGAERRHEAGAGIQAVARTALLVFVNVKAWEI